MTEYQVHARKTNFKPSYVLSLKKILKGRHNNFNCISIVLQVPWPIIRVQKIMQCTCTTWNSFSVFSYPPKIKTVTSSLGTILGSTSAFLYWYAVLWNRFSHMQILFVTTHFIKKHHKYIHFSIRITISIYLVNNLFLLTEVNFKIWNVNNLKLLNFSLFEVLSTVNCEVPSVYFSEAQYWNIHHSKADPNGLDTTVTILSCSMVSKNS
jgi:hypothetical protein